MKEAETGGLGLYLGGSLGRERGIKELQSYPGKVVEVVGELVLVVLGVGGARGALQISLQSLEELADAEPLFTVGSPAHVCRRKR